MCSLFLCNCPAFICSIKPHQQKLRSPSVLSFQCLCRQISETFKTLLFRGWGWLKWSGSGSLSGQVSVCPVRRGCARFYRYLHMCASSEWPLWRDKRPIEGARTDGRTERLGGSHRALRLQCSRRHVARIPFHLHLCTSCRLRTNTANHDAAQRRMGDWETSGTSRRRRERCRAIATSAAPGLIYIEIFSVWFICKYMPKADRNTEAERQKYKLQLRERNPMELIKISHPESKEGKKQVRQQRHRWICHKKKTEFVFEYRQEETIK